MSDFSAIGVIFAFGLASAFIWQLIDTRIWNHFETVATGINQNLPMSIEHRRLYLSLRWFGEVGMMVATLSGAALGFVLFARNAGAEQVRLFAYALAFVTASGAASYLIQAPLLYSRLRALLRQAEAR
jgi:hypothetical protein